MNTKATKEILEKIDLLESTLMSDLLPENPTLNDVRNCLEEMGYSIRVLRNYTSNTWEFDFTYINLTGNMIKSETFIKSISEINYNEVLEFIIVETLNHILNR